MHSPAMPEQAKAPPTSQAPPSGGPRGLERLLEAAAVVAFLVFAVWSAWQFVSHSRDPAAPFFDPRTHPNSLAVQFTAGEYLETFGPWRGIGAMPRAAWGLAAVWIFILWLLTVLLRPAFGRAVPRAMLFALLMGTLAFDFFLTAVSPRLYLSTPVRLPLPFVTVALVILCLLARRRGFLEQPLTARHTAAENFLLACRRWRRGLLVRLGVALMLTLAFLAASTPPIESDGLRYHLAAPAIWVERGSMAPIEGMAFSHFPFLIEMWYLAALRHAQPIAAKLAHFGFALVTLALLAAFTRRLAKWARIPVRGLPLMAVALATATPAFLIVSTWEFIDAGVVCYHLASLSAFALWWHSGRASHLLLAAAFAGLMLGTKYTALVPAFVLGLGVIFHRQPALGRWPYTLAERASNGLVFALIALAVGSPWYLRNWIQTGNPVYPLANARFQAPGWDEESQALWEERAASKGVGFDWHLADDAWRGATFEWLRFEEQSIGLAPWLLAPLGLAGLLLLAIQRGGWWSFHLLYIAATFALWFRTYQSNRLLLPVLLCALPGAAVGLGHLLHSLRALRFAVVFALAAAGTYQCLWIARHFLTQQCPVQLALGFMEPDAWRSLRLNHFDGARAIRALVSPQEQVLVIGESRRFDFPANVVMSDWFDPPAVRSFLAAARSSGELTAALASAEITHVFINHAELLAPGGVPPALIREDGTLDAPSLWQAWRRGEAPPGSNLWFFRRRFTDAQAALLADWLSGVPHRAVWHGDQPGTVGVELWRVDLPAPDSPSDVRN